MINLLILFLLTDAAKMIAVESNHTGQDAAPLVEDQIVISDDESGSVEGNTAARDTGKTDVGNEGAVFATLICPKSNSIFLLNDEKI